MSGISTESEPSAIGLSLGAGFPTVPASELSRTSRGFLEVPVLIPAMLGLAVLASLGLFFSSHLDSSLAFLYIFYTIVIQKVKHLYIF